MHDDLMPLLRDLIRLPGLSGAEAPVAGRLRQAWEPLVDEIEISPLGSLHARKFGSGPAPRPSVMLAAHMDAIGLIVRQIVDGFLRPSPIGGLDARVLPGQPVVVHGAQDLPGLIVQPPNHSLSEPDDNGVIPLEELLIDTGLSAREVERKVRIGDLISFAQEPIELGDDLLAGHSLDNRASLAALTACLQRLARGQPIWDVVAVATVQEELNLGGALTSAFALRPTIAVAIDVTWARQNGLPEHKTFALGEGPTNLWGPNAHPAVFEAIQSAGEAEEIALHKEIAPTNSGTDAVALQISAEGIPTGVISIPLRYMHTPVELVSLKDIQRAGRLLAAFVASLKADPASWLTWD